MPQVQTRKQRKAAAKKTPAEKDAEALSFGGESYTQVKPSSKRIKKADKSKRVLSKKKTNSKAQFSKKKSLSVPVSKQKVRSVGKHGSNILKEIGAEPLVQWNRKQFQAKETPRSKVVQFAKGGKSGSQAKFTPTDQLELSLGPKKPFEIAKSVREPNYARLNVSNEEEFNSEGVNSPNQKKKRPNDISKFKSKNARVVARDSLHRNQIVQEKPRELMRRDLNKRGGTPQKLTARLLQNEPPKPSKASGRQVQVNYRRVRNHSVIQLGPSPQSPQGRQPQAPERTKMDNNQKSTSLEAKAKTPAGSQRRTPEFKAQTLQLQQPRRSVTPQKQKRSIEEEARRANMPVDEYLLFGESVSQRLSARSGTGRKSTLRSMQQMTSKRASTLHQVAQEQIKAESKPDMKEDSSWVDLAKVKGESTVSQVEFKNSNTIILEPLQHHIVGSEEAASEKIAATPLVSKCKRADKQARKARGIAKAAAQAAEAGPKPLVPARELKALKKVLSKVEANIEDEAELRKCEKKIKAFLRYVENLKK